MSDKLKKSIIIIVIVLINVILIACTGTSVLNAIKNVLKKEGESSTEIANNNEHVDNNEIIQDNESANIVLETVIKGVKVSISSENEIKYLQYTLDNDEMKTIEINEKQYENVIQLTEGQHNLKLEVIDVNQVKTSKEQIVIGDVEPTVNVQSKLINGKVSFVIDVEDDENIKTISIIHNGGEKQNIDVNEKIYHQEIVMTEGETNTLIVTATNENDLQKTRRIKFDNK